MQNSDKLLEKLLWCEGNINCILKMLKQLKLYDCTFTLEEIGKVLNITRERVRQIEQNAIKKLKHPKVGRLLKSYTQL
jgi:DNA-directed RNA polymerase sigma subunit (sigma70/sigma32)